MSVTYTSKIDMNEEGVNEEARKNEERIEGTLEEENMKEEKEFRAIDPRDGNEQ